MLRTFTTSIAIAVTIGLFAYVATWMVVLMHDHWWLYQNGGDHATEIVHGGAVSLVAAAVAAVLAIVFIRTFRR